MPVDSDNHEQLTVQGKGAIVPTERVAQSVNYSDEMSMDLFGARGMTAGRSPTRQVTLAQVMHHKWLALVVFLVIAIPGIGATWYLQIPLYKAQGAMLVKSNKPRIAYDVEDDRGNSRQRRNDQAANLNSPQVLNRVLEDPQVRQTRWYKDPPKSLLGGTLSDLERLQDSLDISTPRDSSLIYVSMSCRAPDEAALIVNKVIEHCIAFVADDYDTDDDEILDLQKDKLNKLELDVTALTQDIQSLLETSGLYTEDPSALVEQKRLRLDIKESELQELKGSLLLAQEQMKRLRDRRESNEDEAAEATATDTLPPPPPAADPEWRRLNEDWQDAKFATEVAVKRYGESHTQMIALRETEKNAQKKLTDYERQMAEMPGLASGASGAGVLPGVLSLEGLQTRIADLQIQIAMVNNYIAATTEQLAESTRQINKLRERQAKLAQKRAEATRYRELSLARETESEAPPWLKPRPAFTPSQPTNGKRRFMMLAMMLFGGLGLGIAAAYLRASTNQAIFTASEVIGQVETPFLGYLPRIRTPEALSPVDESIQTEHIRMIRTALLERVEKGRDNAVLITSAGAKAGKTTVAILLAKSLAHCGKRVLLVDADLRNPSLSKRCEVESGPGLIDVLRKQTSDELAITSNGVRGLHILPAGRLNAELDPELLANGRFHASLNRWRREYDVVVLDTAPIMPVADARILAREVDGTVMVLREGHCRRDDVLEAYAILSTSGSCLLGTVFVGARHHSRYSPYYGGYYNYQVAAGAGSEMDVRES